MKIEEAIDMVGRLERFREKSRQKTETLQDAARLAREGKGEEARRLKAQVDKHPVVFGADVLPAMQAMKKEINQLRQQCAEYEQAIMEMKRKRAGGFNEFYAALDRLCEMVSEPPEVD